VEKEIRNCQFHMKIVIRADSERDWNVSLTQNNYSVRGWNFKSRSRWCVQMTQRVSFLYGEAVHFARSNCTLGHCRWNASIFWYAIDDVGVKFLVVKSSGLERYDCKVYWVGRQYRTTTGCDSESKEVCLRH
jgi:hypothetical protein